MRRVVQIIHVLWPEKIARQRGVTLVELMIATALMSLLVAGAVQLYTTTRRVDVIAFQATEMYDNGLYTFRQLQNLIGQAGFRENVTQYSDLSTTFLNDDAHLFVAGQFLTGTEDTSGSDTMRFRYAGATAQSVRDCRGELVGADHVAVITLYLDDQVLSCSNTIVSQSDPSVVVSATQNVALLRHVHDMEVMYRVQTGGGQLSFETAAQVSDWSEVVGVSMMLALGTAQPIQLPKDQTITLFDTQHAENHSGRLIKPFLFSYHFEQQL